MLGEYEFGIASLLNKKEGDMVNFQDSQIENFALDVKSNKQCQDLIFTSSLLQRLSVFCTKRLFQTADGKSAESRMGVSKAGQHRS